MMDLSSNVTISENLNDEEEFSNQY